MKKSILLIALLTASACSSQQEAEQRQQQATVDECTKEGYQPGTTAFDDCQIKVWAQEEEKKVDRMSAVDNAQPFKSDRSGWSPPPSGSMTIPLP